MCGGGHWYSICISDPKYWVTNTNTTQKMTNCHIGEQPVSRFCYVSHHLQLVLENSFSDEQSQSLEDYIELSLMLQHRTNSYFLAENTYYALNEIIYASTYLMSD